MFYKAEGLRLFKCEGALAASVKDDVSELLASPTQYLGTVSDYHSSFMINKRAKHYGAEQSQAFYEAFTKQVESWLDFNVDYFGLKQDMEAGRPGGVTADSVRLLEMMASMIKDGRIGSKVQAKVARAYERLFTHAATRSTDENSPLRSFFVAPKGLTSSNFDNTMVNLHALSGLIEARKALALDKMGVAESDFALYRNYFASKLGTVKVSTAFYALRGLKNLQD